MSYQTPNQRYIKIVELTYPSKQKGISMQLTYYTGIISLSATYLGVVFLFAAFATALMNYVNNAEATNKNKAYKGLKVAFILLTFASACFITALALMYYTLSVR